MRNYAVQVVIFLGRPARSSSPEPGIYLLYSAGAGPASDRPAQTGDAAPPLRPASRARLTSRASTRTSVIRGFDSMNDHRISDLIRAGESDRLEFKATLRWNIHAKHADKEMGLEVIKTVCILVTFGWLILSHLGQYAPSSFSVA